jgi:hypothetical protein
MYALAASAAGVGALALAQPAEAKIVYTPAHVKLTLNQTYGIDLNHDGSPDIYFGWHTSALGYERVFATANPSLGNGVAVVGGIPEFAVPIVAGAKIGAARHFYANSGCPCLVYGYVGGTKSSWKGLWAGTGKGLKNRYLGIELTINGQSHYGWARVTIELPMDTGEALLTGYAYETTANKPIIAGKTKEHDDISIEAPNASLTPATPRPTTLGMWALGAPALSISRRVELVGAKSQAK